MTTPALDDLLALVRRELGADDVRVVERGSAHIRSVPVDEPSPGPGGGGASVSCELPDGIEVVARFRSPPPDLAALQRRLEMICASLGERVVDGPGASSRPAPLRTLRDELAALAMRAGALVAFVMDAHSPVLWGIGGHERGSDEPGDVYPALHGDDEAGETGVTGADVLALNLDRPEVTSRGPAAEATIGPVDARVTDSDASEPANDEDLVAKSMDAVRALPATETLPRGGHINELVVFDDWTLLARSFAAIYVLVLVFDEVVSGVSEPRPVSATSTPVRPLSVRPGADTGGGGVDELVARRAVLHALPAIEQLVLSLPPVDPPPGVDAQLQIRRRTRRR
ncbi:MAG: hypothetical protein WKG00_01030 [Polyangiaceae bacterium]